jgi:predicted dehydrogenase
MSGTVQRVSLLAENPARIKAIRVGVIGLGVGAQHASAYAKDTRCRVTVLCDRDLNKLREHASSYPEVETTVRADEVLHDPDIDLVSIASWDDMHYAMAMTALKNGKHVFIEKPLCQTSKELKSLHTVWSRRSEELKLSSNLVLRAAPLYLWLREQIHSGALGEIYAVDADYLYGRMEKITTGWRKDVEHYSVMEGGGVHMVDLVLWLTGQRPKKVTTRGNRIATRDTEFRYNDYMAATLEFPTGLIARVTANFGCVHRHHHGIRVYGTRGTFIYDDAGARLHTSREPSETAHPITESPLPSGKGALIPDFIDAVAGRKDTRTETQSHFDAMSVIIASDTALKARSAKEIRYL